MKQLTLAELQAAVEENANIMIKINKIKRDADLEAAELMTTVTKIPAETLAILDKIDRARTGENSEQFAGLADEEVAFKTGIALPDGLLFDVEVGAERDTAVIHPAWDWRYSNVEIKNFEEIEKLIEIASKTPSVRELEYENAYDAIYEIVVDNESAWVTFDNEGGYCGVNKGSSKQNKYPDKVLDGLLFTPAGTVISNYSIAPDSNN